MGTRTVGSLFWWSLFLYNSRQFRCQLHAWICHPQSNCYKYKECVISHWHWIIIHTDRIFFLTLDLVTAFMFACQRITWLGLIVLVPCKIECTLVEATSDLYWDLQWDYLSVSHIHTQTHAHTPQPLLFQIVSEPFLAQHTNLYVTDFLVNINILGSTSSGYLKSICVINSAMTMRTWGPLFWIFPFSCLHVTGL